MNTSLQDILIAFELHDARGIQHGFDQGIDPNRQVDGKPLIYALIDMYSRGPGFKECIRVFAEHGLIFEDQVLLAVLLDDAASLDAFLQKDRSCLSKKYTFNCTFTPLIEASLLHICAEYNHVSCAEVLIHHGADVNFCAGLDEHGFGGQTPVFHTVNQDANKSFEMMKLLVANQADLTLTVKGLIWGKGYEWETFIPEVNPVSYTMMGLLPQFQRKETDIYQVVSFLLKAKYGIAYLPENIPNRYLNS